MMRSRGVHILDNFPCFMTTAHTPQDIATIKSAFKESVAELQQAEFLPARTPAAPQAVDASKPPVPGARLGRGPNGEVQWYVPHPDDQPEQVRGGDARVNGAGVLEKGTPFVRTSSGALRRAVAAALKESRKGEVRRIWRTLA